MKTFKFTFQGGSFTIYRGYTLWDAILKAKRDMPTANMSFNNVVKIEEESK